MRAFIAVPISDESKERIAALIPKLAGGNFNIVYKENFHLTLKFLGEIDDRQLESVKSVLSGFSKNEKRFEAELQSVGVFPNPSYIKVIWVGLSPDKEYAAFAKRLDERLSSISFKKEKSYIPHMTFARVKSVSEKDKLREFIDAHANDTFGRASVDRVILMKSELQPGGPVYTELASYPLA
ncbi:MAG: RNA 2',3'-cyclic phosphodiesterase [archaeon]